MWIIIVSIILLGIAILYGCFVLFVMPDKFVDSEVFNFTEEDVYNDLVKKDGCFEKEPFDEN